MNYDYFLSTIPAFAAAGALTLKLSFWGILFAFLIGFFCLLMNYFQVRFVNTLCKIYVEFSRNTPLIIQLFFLYYALPKFNIHLETLFPFNLICLSVEDVVRPSFACGVLGLGFLGGSYMAETFRAGFEAVRRQQFEAGLALGFSRLGNLRYVILPQAMAVAMPGISANIIFFIKETSVVSIIALPDLVALMKNLNAITYRTDELLLLLFLGYLCIILPLSLILYFIERRFAKRSLAHA